MNPTRRKKTDKLRSGPPTAKDHARLVRALGVAICRIDPGKKQPVYAGWPTRSLEPDDIGRDDHLGILTGALSNGGHTGHSLVGVDLDAPDAVRLADKHLPATKMVEGRPSKPRSHPYYLVPNWSVPREEYSTAAQAAAAATKFAGHPGPRTRCFRDSDGREILRVAGTGCQLVCPPSLHPSGERRAWGTPDGRPGRPAVVLYGDFLSAVERLARACGFKQRTGHAVGGVGAAGAATAVKLDAWLEHRIEMYLDACPPAVSGHGGHAQLFRVTIALLHGFALDPEGAMAVLRAYYNPRCRPPWSERELRHKVEDALRVPHDKPYGYLLTDSTSGGELPDDTPTIIRAAFAEAVTGRQGRLMRSSRRRGTR